MGDVLAILYTDRNGLDHKICGTECLKKVFVYDLFLHNTLDLEGYLSRQQAMNHMESFTIVEDDNYSGTSEYADENERIFGKVCDHCRTTLGSWHVCRFCHCVEWVDASHTCFEFSDALHSEDNENHVLAIDVMDGLESGFIEDGFIEDQL